MNAAAYLDADVSTLADREHTNTHTNTNRPHLVRARRPLTDAHLSELEYAVDLLRRADKGISAELAVLHGLDLEIDWGAVQRACCTLVSTAVLLHLRVKREHARRSA
jgi:hypothetical protein